jgi:hypothetical protein
MKQGLVALFLCLISATAAAKGLTFALPSLEQAEDVVRQDARKHVMVFFTHEN